VNLDHLPPTSACAVVARSSATRPEFVVADDDGPRLVAALWRRHHAHLSEPARLDDHVLSYCLRGGALSTIVIDGVRRHAVQQTGSVTFVPAARRVQWLLEAPVEMMHVHLYISAEALPADAAPDARLNLRDPWLDGFFRLLLAEHEACRCEAGDRRFDLLDRTGDLLVQHLVGLRRGAHAAQLPSRVSPLRAPVLRRIEAFVEDNLAANIRLDDMAAIAAMSVDHFVRAFREATGSTPHRWLLERRLDRAGALLGDSGEQVSAIARRCGFAGAAHFATAFRSRHGMSPTQYRRRR
jgi:AraC family transcriptional regulator